MNLIIFTYFVPTLRFLPVKHTRVLCPPTMANGDADINSGAGVNHDLHNRSFPKQVNRVKQNENHIFH